MLTKVILSPIIKVKERTVLSMFKVGANVRIVDELSWAKGYEGMICELVTDGKFFICFPAYYKYYIQANDITWGIHQLELIGGERAEDEMMTVKEIAEKRLMMKGLVIELKDAANVFFEDSIAYQVLRERAEAERKELEAFDRKIFTPVMGEEVAE